MTVLKVETGGDIVAILNAPESNTLTRLTVCYVNFISVKKQLDIVTHACNPSTQEAGAGRS
jgi:hypothetical protein